MFCICISNCLETALISVSHLQSRIRLLAHASSSLLPPVLTNYFSLVQKRGWKLIQQVKSTPQRGSYTAIAFPLLGLFSSMFCRTVKKLGIICHEALWIQEKGREGSHSKASEIFQYVAWITTQSLLKPMETVTVLSVFFGLSFRWAEKIEQVIFPKPGGTIQ